MKYLRTIINWKIQNIVKKFQNVVTTKENCYYLAKKKDNQYGLLKILLIPSSHTQLSNINCYTKPWYAYNTSNNSNLRLKGQYLKKRYENP